MGLYNYFGHRDTHTGQVYYPHHEFYPPLRLSRKRLFCLGGRKNQFQFYGDRYNYFILRVTGESLGQEKIPKTVVKEMSRKLNALAADRVEMSVVGRACGLKYEECLDLVMLFDVAASLDCTLFGCY